MISSGQSAASARVTTVLMAVASKSQLSAQISAILAGPSIVPEAQMLSEGCSGGAMCMFPAPGPVRVVCSTGGARGLSRETDRGGACSAPNFTYTNVHNPSEHACARASQHGATA